MTTTRTALTSKGIHIDDMVDSDGITVVGRLRGVREHAEDCNPGNCEDMHGAEFGA